MWRMCSVGEGVQYLCLIAWRWCGMLFEGVLSIICGGGDA